MILRIVPFLFLLKLYFLKLGLLKLGLLKLGLLKLGSQTSALLNLVPFTLALLLTGCIAPFDYAEDIDFSRISTVALAPDSDVNSLDGARIAAAAIALLPARGLALASPEQASVWLHYQLQAETKLLTTLPSMLHSDRYGWGGSGWNSEVWNSMGWNDDERVYAAVLQHRLLLWLTPAASQRVIWRSKQQAVFPAEKINGSKRRARIQEQVGELLNNYPPPHAP